MARIYKESRYVLQLLIGKSYVAQYDDVKISFYTKNPSNQVMVDNGITIKRNIAEVMVESTLFDNLEEGLISYIVYGTKDGIPFIEERQSNYFLKAPLDFKPTTCILEDKSVTPSMGERNNDGYIVVEEGEGYDGLSRVVINPQTLYNEGVEAGYEQGQANVAANARVLNVTENGVYKTKFSDPIIPTITGVYADGTDFYNYAELGNKVFNTKIAATQDSRLEFWYKGDKTFRDSYDVIIGAGNIDKNTNTCFRVTYYTYLYTTIWVEIGNSRIEVENWDDTVWHHLIISKAEGLWIDGEKKGDFSPTNTISGEFYINGISYDVNGDGGGIKTANGYFGMIKIDDVVIIPTANGFKNVNTGELLEVVKDGTYTFTENPPTYGEGELYKTINVNVPDLNGSYDEGYAQGKTDGVNEQKGKLESINITENGTYTKEDGYNHIEVNVPDLNGSYEQGKTDGINEQKLKLESINITQNGTYTKEDGYNQIEVNVTDLDGSYDAGYVQGKTEGYNQGRAEGEGIGYIRGRTDGIDEQKGKLTQIRITENGTYAKEDGYNQIEVNVNSIPKINIQETGLKFGYSTFTEVPEWADFKGLTNTTYMFQNCYNLQTIPMLDTSNVTDMNYMFMNCSNLQTIPHIDTSNVINMNNMFMNCSNLQTIPAIDTSNVANMSSMFIYCDNLRTLPELNVSKVTNINAYFKAGGSNLTDVGGWKNLKINWNDSNGLARCPNLTRQSCINVLNGLYDFVGNGSTETRTLKVHANFLTTVGEDISIGTSRGWTITA